VPDVGQCARAVRQNRLGGHRLGKHPLSPSMFEFAVTVGG
jgi:hypothetical protein